MKLLPALTPALLPVALLCLATGCGTTEEAAGADPGTDRTPTAEAGPVSLTDARGTELELDAPADDVVALEWNVAEHLVSLGVMPVGVADVEGYGAWVATSPLDGSVTDVGVRGEPSVEAIGGLAPDLIITTTDYETSVAEDFEDRGIPVLVVEPADASDGLGRMRENVELVAEATGTTDRAADLLSEFHATLEEGAAAIEEAGLAGDSFFMTDGYLEGGQLSIRPYARGSLLSDVAERLGLRNAWTQEGDPAYGLDSTDVEGLTALPEDVHFLYVASGNDDPFQEALGDNAIWNDFEFVRTGDVHRIPDGIWMFGGPASMTAYVDAVVERLTAP